MEKPARSQDTEFVLTALGDVVIPQFVQPRLWRGKDDNIIAEQNIGGNYENIPLSEIYLGCWIKIFQSSGILLDTAGSQPVSSPLFCATEYSTTTLPKGIFTPGMKPVSV
jgi:hypothetical protein